MQMASCAEEDRIPPLNESGLNEGLVAATIHSFALRNVSRIYSSPLERAEETAKIFSKALIPLEIIRELSEWDLGSWEMMTSKTIGNPFASKTTPPGGESWIEFKNRVMRGLNALPIEPTSPLIVGHGGTWHALHEHFQIQLESVARCVPYLIHRKEKMWTVDTLPRKSD